ncbi:hypothetical protein Syun_006231 [Stephania yunnanensis]|uniref:Uncharacterized protein n=1 Tax=Stephania yunnanensis TaxID=152371 RepID=A0AAP0KX89_9MAGN
MPKSPKRAELDMQTQSNIEERCPMCDFEDGPMGIAGNGPNSAHTVGGNMDNSAGRQIEETVDRECAQLPKAIRDLTPGGCREKGATKKDSPLFHSRKTPDWGVTRMLPSRSTNGSDQNINVRTKTLSNIFPSEWHSLDKEEVVESEQVGSSNEERSNEVSVDEGISGDSLDDSSEEAYTERMVNVIGNGDDDEWLDEWIESQVGDQIETNPSTFEILVERET